jgi:hypothetical protein
MRYEKDDFKGEFAMNYIDYINMKATEIYKDVKARMKQIESEAKKEVTGSDFHKSIEKYRISREETRESAKAELIEEIITLFHGRDALNEALNGKEDKESVFIRKMNDKLLKMNDSDFGKKLHLYVKTNSEFIFFKKLSLQFSNSTIASMSSEEGTSDSFLEKMVSDIYVSLENKLTRKLESKNRINVVADTLETSRKQVINHFRNLNEETQKTGGNSGPKL